MITRGIRRAIIASIFIFSVVLNGCSIAPVTESNKLAPRAPIDTNEPSIQGANELFQRGQQREAADMYYQLALKERPPQRERIILQAAEISASLGDMALTEHYLKHIPQASRQGELEARYQYIQALISLQTRQPTVALRQLPQQQQLTSLTPELRDKILLVRKRAIEMGGTPPAVAGTPSTTPTAPNATTPPPTTSAYVLPASTERLAVLLPNSGAMGEVGNEIFQGVQDTIMAVGGNNRAKCYHVTATNVLSEYKKAINEGADLVIGPLDRDALTRLLSNTNDLSTPILSLNYQTEGNAPSTVYQFGLSPEDEARQIADVALGRGQRTAIVMVPDSSWGSRLAESFIELYQARGGSVVARLNYPNSATDTYLQRVQSTLRAGQAAQMVFLGASPTQARLIRPLLQAQASLLPVYATSHIFSGRLEPKKDVDLDGIIYTEIPFVLDSIKAGSLNQLKYPRLYALGADSVLIANNLSALTQRQNLRGKTGQISLDPQRNIQRRLRLATFINGEPNPLD